MRRRGRKSRKTRSRRRKRTGGTGRAIAKLARSVKRVRRQLNPPSNVQYEEWSTGILKCVENSKSYRSFSIGADADIETAKTKMFRDADGSGAGTASASNTWGRGAWMRLSQLMVTTIRNNYAAPVQIEIMAFKVQKHKATENVLDWTAGPLFLLEKCYNNVTQSATTNCFGGLGTTATTASCDIQVELKRALTPANRKTMPLRFGKMTKIWLQPGQSLTLAKKQLSYRKYTIDGESYLYNMCGFVIGVNGTIGHDTAAPPTSVGYMAAAIDFSNKVYNKLTYGTAFNNFHDYYPDETVLGTTLEVVLPRDPAAESNPTGT